MDRRRAAKFLNSLLSFLKSNGGICGIAFQIGDIALQTINSLRLRRHLRSCRVGFRLSLLRGSLALLQRLLQLLDLLISALDLVRELLDLLLLSIDSLLQLIELI